MLQVKGNTVLSIRDIKFDGASTLEGQRRGENMVIVHYQILTKVFVPEELRHKWVTVKDAVVNFNAEFANDDLKEAIYEVKRLAVRMLKESNQDEVRDIDAAYSEVEQSETNPGDRPVS